MKNRDNRDPNENMSAGLTPVYRLCAVIAAAAIVLFAFVYTRVSAIVLKMTLYIVCAMAIFLAFVIFTSALKVKKMLEGKINYFLYDKKSRKSKSLDSLSFAEIREKICNYMSMFRRGKKLYLGDLFDENIRVPSAFRPLFCYELLYEMSEGGADESRIGAFLSLGQECAGTFYVHLVSAGENEMAEDIKRYFSEFSSGNKNEKEFAKYLAAKREHIESSVMRYLKEHINEF